MNDVRPIDVFLLLYFLIPLGLICWKFSDVRVSWRFIFGVSTIFSWVFCYAALQMEPARNGFTHFFYLLTGWFWMLPCVATFSVLAKMLSRRMQPAVVRGIGNIGMRAMLSLSLCCVLWGKFGWISERTAINCAQQELELRNYRTLGEPITERREGKWVVKYPRTSFKEIGLTRNGRMSWIGGF